MGETAIDFLDAKLWISPSKASLIMLALFAETLTYHFLLALGCLEVKAKRVVRKSGETMQYFAGNILINQTCCMSWLAKRHLLSISMAFQHASKVAMVLQIIPATVFGLLAFL